MYNNNQWNIGDVTFPDDRRYALLKIKENGEDDNDSCSSSSSTSQKIAFDPNDPSWLHKENFICAFTEPELMASFISRYEIIKQSMDSARSSNDDDENENENDVQRLFTLHDREGYNYNQEGPIAIDSSSPPVLGPIYLNTQHGRDQLSMFFMRKQLEKDPLSMTTTTTTTTTKLICATQIHSKKHTHQFGNTSSGVKNNNGDTRTIHIINEATVREVEDAINNVHAQNGGDIEDGVMNMEELKVQLNAMRFRPNIVVDGLEPWKEFEFVGKHMRLVKKNNSKEGDVDSSCPITFRVLSRTVRCDGVGIDPTDPDPQKTKLDIPQLLNKNFPEHGPYLGVYAVIESDGDGTISVGDSIELVEDEDTTTSTST